MLPSCSRGNRKNHASPRPPLAGRGLISVPQVFISHSTNHDPRSADVRKQVQRELEGRGWLVFVDNDALRGGEEWKDVLYRWLADCDAAVVFVSEKALASPWVRREVSLLLWRRALGSPLTIVPVLLRDVSREQVEESDLADLLALEFVREEVPAVADAMGESLASRIVDRLPDLSTPLRAAPDGMQAWLDDIDACLTTVDHDRPLREALRALGADDWHFTSIREGRRLLAHQMLGPGLSARIVAALRQIARQTSGSLQRLIDLVAPVWVDGEAARALLPAGGQVFVLLNARLPETARHYVHRAACCSLYFRTETVTLIVGEDLAREFLHDCERAVRRLLGLRDIYPLDGEPPLDGDIGFLVVDPRSAPVDLVIDLLRPLLLRFEWLNVILLVGPAVPEGDILRRWGMADAVLRPELGCDEEKVALRIADRLQALHQQVVSRTHAS